LLRIVKTFIDRGDLYRFISSGLAHHQMQHRLPAMYQWPEMAEKGGFAA